MSKDKTLTNSSPNKLADLMVEVKTILFRKAGFRLANRLVLEHSAKFFRFFHYNSGHGHEDRTEGGNQGSFPR